ncbi:MAG: hypothetical protein R3327_03895 [Nitrosopumilaceae archaeon]|nr:hypothetical protein [Nitrosopumilaceae archaeon]
MRHRRTHHIMSLVAYTVVFAFIGAILLFGISDFTGKMIEIP